MAKHCREAAVLIALAAGRVGPVAQLEPLGLHGLAELLAYGGLIVGRLSRVEQSALERGRFGPRMFAARSGGGYLSMRVVEQGDERLRLSAEVMLSVVDGPFGDLDCGLAEKLADWADATLVGEEAQEVPDEGTWESIATNSASTPPSAAFTSVKYRNRSGSNRRCRNASCHSPTRSDLVQVKYEMVRRAGAADVPASRAAADFGFSRQSLYSARAGLRERGLAGLVPAKPGPKGRPRPGARPATGSLASSAATTWAVPVADRCRVGLPGDSADRGRYPRLGALGHPGVQAAPRPRA